MTWLGRLLLAVTCLLLAGPASAQGRAAGAPETATEAERQVLVLLKLPAAHFRANQTYGGGYGDSAGQAARQRIAARLARQHGLAMVTNWPMPLVGVD